MFLVFGTYIRPIEEIDSVLDGHFEFIDRYIEAGKIILAGRRNPRFGGILVCAAANRSEVEGMLQEDPFWKNKLMDYQITEFVPVKYVEGLEKCLMNDQQECK